MNSTVEKLMAYRDATEAEKGPDADMDQLVEQNLIKLLMDSNRVADVPTMRWCHEQLERERARHSLRPMDLVPSGILDARDAPASSSMRRPSANPGLSALGVYDWNPNPRIPVQRHSFPQRAVMSPNPFSRDAPAFVPNPFRANAPAFVPNPFRANAPAFVPNRSNRPNRPRRGGKTRTNKGKKGKKSIRRGKH